MALNSVPSTTVSTGMERMSGGGGSGAITPSILSSQFPHLSHYVNTLLQTANQEAITNKPQQSTSHIGALASTIKEDAKRDRHPLSVSSASSDVHDEDEMARDESMEPQDIDGEVLSPSKEKGTTIGSMSTAGSDAGDRLELPGGSASGERAASVTSSGTSASRDDFAKPIPVSSADREELTRSVVDLLSQEKEEEVKQVLKDKLGPLGNDHTYIDQVCLELMHKHKDDLEKIPYVPFNVTPIRPKGSPLPSHAQPFRPFSPSRVPVFRTRTPLGRSQTPTASPGAGVIGAGSPKLTRTISASSSIGGGHGASSVLGAAGFGGNSPRASPANSPKMGASRTLNISSGPFSPSGGPTSARPFSPGPNGQSGMGLNFGTTASGSVTPVGNNPKLGMHLPPPSNVAGLNGQDPWAAAFGKINSPLSTPPIMSRSPSFNADVNTDEGSSYAFPTTGNPAAQNPSSRFGSQLHQSHPTAQDHEDDGGVDDIFSTSAMDRHQHMLPDEDDDEFSPFARPSEQENGKKAGGSPVTKLMATAKAFDPTKLNPTAPTLTISDMAGNNPSARNSPQPLGGSFFGGGGGVYNEHDEGEYSHFGAPEDYGQMPGGMMTPGGSFYPQEGQPAGSDDPNYLGEGMTPLDVLQSVFTSLPVGELEEALQKTAYNFEEAMALLISQNGGTRSGNASTYRDDQQQPRPNVFAPGGPASRSREMQGLGGYYHSGGRSGFGMGGPGNASPRLGMGSGTRTPGGLKMCRYYLAGECRRSDCRFSHDVDRALCRFWLRGQCAKGDQCEFIHALPSVDPNMLTNAMSRIELASDGTSRPRQRVDEFPDLNLAAGQRGAPFDPSRNRFANAVKRPMPGPAANYTHIGGPRSAPVAPPGNRSFGSGGGSFRRRDGANMHGPPLPHPSPRLKLRPPTLMPTVTTGAALNEMYLEARQAAIKLGQSRNACLARAAEAWRRGDGATAKRFSREANVFNERMTVEAADAAANLVRQRRIQAQDAIRSRGEWSNDPEDRSSRGKECAGGLGVVMGVAGSSSLGHGADKMSSGERTEVLLDLHMLHANEASDVLEDFLMALERERFLGLAFVIVGDERHVGTQDTGRGASRHRLAAGVKTFLHRYGYPWSESGGCICIDPLTHT